MSTQVVVLDVNETLTDLEPLRARLRHVGAPEHLLETWFAATLRDGFALAAAGSSAPFREVAAGALQALLPDVEEDDVLDGFAALPLHADVAAGLHALSEAGLRVVTLSNGASSVAESVLERAGLLGLVEQRLSVEDAGRWKPHRDAYAYAARACGVDVAALCLVAVHPWDCDGALRAGLSAAWLDRRGATYPRALRRPELTVQRLEDLAQQLGT